MANFSVFNFNIGILGHVDSGKTSLAKALSTTASTAAFDKNPQSQERGITLDLGFSSFVVDPPPTLTARDDRFGKFGKIQFTFVDCPGHASLIRTIMGGSQIIDLVLLVVDAQKGVQTQTAECLILAEITCPERMIVVLNKIDVFPEEHRQNSVEKITKRLRKTLETTSFKNCPIVPTAANPQNSTGPQIEELLKTLYENVYFPSRNESGPFLFAVDHCFGIKGQGTVMTGTVLSGCLKQNENVEIASLKDVKRVKSMQIFRQPVEKICQGDRAGICVTQFDSKLFERGVICQPNFLQPLYAAVVDTRKIAYFKSKIETKMKFLICVGYEASNARCRFFGCVKTPCDCSENGKNFNFAQEYGFLPGLDEKHENEENSEEILNNFVCTHKYALLEFEKPILCPKKSLYIASKLDSDIHANVCRLAFHGRFLHEFFDKNYAQISLPTLKIFKFKQRRGVVERMTDEFTVIAHGISKKETNIDPFVGLKVDLTTGETGSIEGNFGQTGKMKIRVGGQGLSKNTVDLLQTKAESKKKGKKQGGETENVSASAEIQTIGVILRFKRYVYDLKKQMIQ